MKCFINNRLKPAKTNLNRIAEKIEKAKRAKNFETETTKNSCLSKYNNALELYQTIATPDSWFQQ